MATNALMHSVLTLARTIEKKAMSGIEKRTELMRILKELMGDEKFNEAEPVINCILETIIFISKTHQLSGINVNSFLCC
jgi:predicted transcriptional regulator